MLANLPKNFNDADCEDLRVEDCSSDDEGDEYSQIDSTTQSR